MDADALRACCLFAFHPCGVDHYIRFRSGGNSDYTMDLHQKEQLHDNAMSMMQSQHFSVSLNLKTTLSNNKMLYDLRFFSFFSGALCRWGDLLDST